MKGISSSQRGYYQSMNDIKITDAVTTASVLAGASVNADVDISEDISINKDIFIHTIDMYSSASDNFSVEVYMKTARTAKTFIARCNSETIGGVIVIKKDYTKPLYYKDEDGTSKLFLKIINTDGVNASTFTYRLSYGVA